MNPIPCCGVARATRFCPDCGKQLRQDCPLTELLQHCRKQARQADKSLRLRQERLADWDPNDPRRQRHLGILERTLERWTRWAAALETVLEPRKDGSP